MLVEFGNAAPIDSRGARIDLGSPTVTYVHIPDTYTFESGIDVRDFLVHLADHPSVTHLPGHEAALAIADLSGGLWATHSAIDPTWVWSDNPVFESFLAEFYKLATPGKPSDVEDTHFTRFGPPGVGPWANPVEANITLAGRDIWARALGGGSVGAAGTATATSSTSLTNSGATWTTNQWQGMRVVSGGVWGNISSNTGTVLTVDRWYTPSNAGRCVVRGCDRIRRTRRRRRRMVHPHLVTSRRHRRERSRLVHGHFGRRDSPFQSFDEYVASWRNNDHGRWARSQDLYLRTYRSSEHLFSYVGLHC